MNRALVLIIVVAGICWGQPQRPLDVSELTDYWSSKSFETKEILNLIDKNGAAVDWSEASMISLFEAARKANRTSGEMAEVVVRLLRECRDCRTRFWAPLGPDDISLALKRGSAATLDELRVRGMTDLPVSTGFTQSLASAGAAPDLIAYVEDRIAMPVPEGFKPLHLDKAADFDPKATEGKLTLHVFIDNEVVFLFRHNALFFKTSKGDDPASMGCTFTGFGPASSEPVKWTGQVTPMAMKGRKPKKMKEPIRTVVPDPSGRPGLQLTVDATDKDRHEYDIEFKWTR